MSKLLHLSYKEKTINNIHSYYIKQTNNDNFVAGIYIPYGANMKEYTIDNQTVKSGAAHFLEHRLFDSINGDVMKLCASLGLDANAETSPTYTLYYIYGNKKNVLKGLKILFDMVFSIKRDDKKIAIERRIILSEKKENSSFYIDKFYQSSYKQTLKNSFYENQIIGSVKDIKSINYDDLILYHDTFYDYHEASFIIIGNISFKKIDDFIINYKFNNVIKHQKDFKDCNIKFKNKSKRIIKNIPLSLYNYSFVLDNEISAKYADRKEYYFMFLNDLLASSPLIDKLKEAKIISEDITLDYLYSNSICYFSFSGYKKNENMKKIINDIFNKYIPNYINQDILNTYFNGKYIELLFNLEDKFNLLDKIVSLIDGNKNVKKELIYVYRFTIEKFYKFIDDIFKYSSKFFLEWKSKEDE